MTTAAELFRYGRKEEIWMKYCGFLDLNIDEFSAIQERLLLEQISILNNSNIGKELLNHQKVSNIDEFRQLIPITSYADYEKYFDNQKDDGLPIRTYLWAHTSGRSGRFKWVPYTETAYQKLGERVLSGVILAGARYKGDVRIDERDTLVYNTPPRPYISGVALRALAEHFNFRFIPPLDETEGMDFQERIAKGFDAGLISGIDVLGSLSVVLVKMGERFAEGAHSTKLSARLFHPKALLRLISGYIRSKIERRNMLPKDLWKVKALPCGGMDTAIYRDQIAHYWGVEPYEQYGSTEEGSIATQGWNKKGMTFFPDAAFLEFVPDSEWIKWREDPDYIPETKLINEIETNRLYEVVITNYYGKPFIRYRMNDIVMFNALQDEETGVNLPQMEFVGRTNDLIDLSGFTGLIDEKMVWQSIVDTKIPFREWTVRKEEMDGKPLLHLYIELEESVDDDIVCQKVHENLKAVNPFYADYERMINKRPLKVTLLAPDTFQAYMHEMQAAGADMAHLKPPHMNPSEDIMNLLLRKVADD